MKSLLMFMLLAGCANVVNKPVPTPTPTPIIAVYRFPLKGVWYRAGQASFVAELSDSNVTVQTDATVDLNQNFSHIKAMGANVVVVSIPDNDDWYGQFGGGAPYNPSAHPRNVPQMEKLVLDAADRAGLKVVFCVGVSSFHRWSDDTYGNPNGATDFFSQIVVDPRVIGWMINDECDPANPQEAAFLKKYWDFFYERFHSPTAWVGVNTVYTPDYIGVIRGLIDKEKQLFASLKHKPDLYGMEWFWGGMVNEQAVAGYLDQMVSWMAEDEYSVPKYQIAFMSGGSSMDQANYYPEAIEQMAKEQIAGLFVWGADGYTNDDCGLHDNTDGNFNLFTTQIAPEPICNAYVLEPWHWMYATDEWTLETQTFRTMAGKMTYTGLTTAGQAIQSEFMAH